MRDRRSSGLLGVMASGFGGFSVYIGFRVWGII